MTEQPALRELLTDEKLLARFGPLPVIPLPQDDEPLLGFILTVADELRDKGLYRRDRVIVVPYVEKRRLEVMEAKSFCSWTMRYFMPAKVKYDQHNEPYSVVKDMPTEVAEKVLVSWDFFPAVPEILEVHPAPMPAIVEDELIFMDEGYHEASRTLTFPLA